MTDNQQQVEKWYAEWLATREPHWGDKINWVTADEIARRLDAEAPQESCLVPAVGWYCTRAAGHSGPCTAHRSPR